MDEFFRSIRGRKLVEVTLPNVAMNLNKVAKQSEIANKIEILKLAKAGEIVLEQDAYKKLAKDLEEWVLNG